MAQVKTISGVDSDNETKGWCSALVKNTKCSFEWTTKVDYNVNLLYPVDIAQALAFLNNDIHTVFYAGPEIGNDLNAFVGPIRPVVLSPVFKVKLRGKPLQFRLGLCILINPFRNADMFRNNDMEVVMKLNFNLLSANQNSLLIAGTSSIFSSNLKQTTSGSFETVYTPLQKKPVQVNFPNKVFIYKSNEIDTIVIHCEIEVSDLSTIQPRHSVDFSQAKAILLQDLSSLYETRELGDFIIRVKGKEFRAHKAILGTRSPVFASMLLPDMLEKNQNCIEITDFNAKTVDEMLRFIYTGESKLHKNMAEDLLSISDKYAIDSLKTVCKDFLMTNTTVETSKDS